MARKPKTPMKPTMAGMSEKEREFERMKARNLAIARAAEEEGRRKAARFEAMKAENLKKARRGY